MAFEHFFDCDCEAYKRMFCQKCGPPNASGNLPCSFPRIEQLFTGQSPCYTRGVLDNPRKVKGKYPDPKLCVVPRGQIWIACTSCKYFSRANPSKKEGPKQNLLDAGGQSQHQSRLTYDGHIAYVRQFKPDIVFYENTDSIADDVTGKELSHVSRAIDVVTTDLEREGYCVRAVKSSSEHYGTGQDRLRVFVVGVLINSSLHSALSRDRLDQVMDRIPNYLLSFQFIGPDIRKLCLPHDDPIVLQELKHRQEVPVVEKRSGWPAIHQKAFAAADMRWGDSDHMFPGLHIHSSPWYRAMPQRMQECIAFHYHTRGPSSSADVSQMIGRLRADKVVDSAGMRMAPTVLPDQCLFVASTDVARPLVVHEMLTLQAFPWQRHKDPLFLFITFQRVFFFVCMRALALGTQKR